MLDQDKNVIDDFRGLYRWYDEDSVPANHFIDCLNLEYIPRGFNSRSGLQLLYSSEAGSIQIKRIKRFEVPGAADRLIALDQFGNLWDASNPGGIGGTAILTIATMTDFSLVSLYGRAYISPHNGNEGLPNQKIYVYDPSISLLARSAGGIAPSDFDLIVATLTPTVALADVAAAQSFSSGVPLTQTANPYLPPTSSTLKFTLVKGTSTITAMTLTVVGKDAKGAAATKVYVNKVLSLGPLTFICVEIWSNITSITPSAIVGGIGTATLNVKVTGKPPGKVEKGLHVIAVAYETASGFITRPGPAAGSGVNYNVFNVVRGGKALTVSGIPAVPPTGVTKIHILASKSIVKSRYTGNPNEYELFFVPESGGGKIDVGTTSANINFFNADLVDSADFLKDNLDDIPAGVTLLATSKGRLLIAGVNSISSVVEKQDDTQQIANNTVIWGSKGGEPESFSATDGFIIVKPGGEGIRNLAEYRTLIYAYKGTRTYATQDNDGLPVTWELNSVDDAIGTEAHGVSISLGSDSASEDVLIVASRSGLQVFNGTYSERPLSWKIREIWDNIVKENKFNQIEVAIDPVNKFLFIAVPFSISGYATGSLLYADYSDGLSWDTIKWCPWVFVRTGPAVLIPSSIFTTFESGIPVLRIGSTDKNVYTYQYKFALAHDNGVAKTAFFQTSNLNNSENGGVTHVTGVRLLTIGPCTLKNSIIGPQGVVTETLPNEIIASPQPSNVLIKLNFVEDRISYKGLVDGLTARMSFSKIWVFGTEAWLERPA